ncbi:hypothetical protein [Bradyrhizobium sp. Rc2d]|uniref:hypothetical protein n=1 Tax=Bradyrhizobium sp. Rc2d TaxID=1855321 RepID=UPI000B84149C|nr:hypothetical protein [Bradyrhizobium sp. Rc2d]
MMVNAIVDAASQDVDLKRYVANETVQIEAFFHRGTVAGQVAAEISATRSAHGLARHLLAALMRIRILVRVRADPGVLAEIARSTLSILCA